MPWWLLWGMRCGVLGLGLVLAHNEHKLCSQRQDAGGGTGGTGAFWRELFRRQRHSRQTLVPVLWHSFTLPSCKPTDVLLIFVGQQWRTLSFSWICCHLSCSPFLWSLFRSASWGSVGGLFVSRASLLIFAFIFHVACDGQQEEQAEQQPIIVRQPRRLHMRQKFSSFYIWRVGWTHRKLLDRSKHRDGRFIRQKTTAKSSENVPPKSMRSHLAHYFLPLLRPPVPHPRLLFRFLARSIQLSVHISLSSAASSFTFASWLNMRRVYLFASKCPCRRL